jgi:hypothetical protein
MRMLITGTDSEGKSCVVSEVDFGGEHGRKMFFWSVAPPPPRPDGTGARLAPRLAENTLHRPGRFLGTSKRQGCITQTALTSS